MGCTSSVRASNVTTGSRIPTLDAVIAPCPHEMFLLQTGQVGPLHSRGQSSSQCASRSLCPALPHQLMLHIGGLRSGLCRQRLSSACGRPYRVPCASAGPNPTKSSSQYVSRMLSREHDPPTRCCPTSVASGVGGTRETGTRALLRLMPLHRQRVSKQRDHGTAAPAAGARVT